MRLQVLRIPRPVHPRSRVAAELSISPEIFGRQVNRRGPEVLLEAMTFGRSRESARSSVSEPAARPEQSGLGVACFRSAKFFSQSTKARLALRFSVVNRGTTFRKSVLSKVVVSSIRPRQKSLAERAERNEADTEAPRASAALPAPVPRHQREYSL